MPISHHDQLTLLKDILSNHQVDCCGSVSECEQLERLVKSLMVNPQIETYALPILEEIYKYGHVGAQSSALDEHIGSYQGQLTDWVDQLQTF